jgi:hypothetical protein
MRRHRTIGRVLVVLGGLLAVLAILAIWISRQALETDQWTKTSSKLLQDPAIQTAVSGYLVDQIYANVDVAGQVRKALPPRVQPLAAPAAGALRNAAQDVAERALQRPRVQAAWEAANRRAHELLVKVVNGGGDVVSTQGGVVTLDLKALLNQVADRTGIGQGAVAKLPDQAATITLLRSDQLSTIEKIAKALKPLALVLTLLTLACFGGAIALAAGWRRETLRACGIAFVLAGIAALLARNVAGTHVVDSLAKTEAIRPAVESVWRIGTSLLVGVAVAAVVYGAVAVAGAWLAGPTRPALGSRRALAPYARDPLLAWGAYAAVVLLVLLWAPTEGTRRLLPTLALLALSALGWEALRRQMHAEHPDAVRGEWAGFGALRERLRGAGSSHRPPPPAPPAVPSAGGDGSGDGGSQQPQDARTTSQPSSG